MPGPKRVTVDIVGSATEYEKATDAAIKASVGMMGKLDDITRRGGIAGSIMQGVGQSIGKSFTDAVNPMGLASRALDAFTGFAGDALDYANAMGAAWRDEQADLAQFHQTLTTAAGGWRMYSAALDKAINAGMDLAFTDDEQRASLSRLVTATGDVTQAIRLNRLAMDISRQRHISLEEAAQAVTKAAQGQTRALRALGYQITDTKDATLALDVVQRQAAGAADTYAATSQGKYSAALIKIADKAEDTGKYFQAAGTAQADFMLGALGTTVNTVDLIGRAMEKWGLVTVQSVDDQQASYDELGKSWAAWAWHYGEQNARVLADTQRTAAELSRTIAGLGDDYVSGLLQDRDTVQEAAKELAFMASHPLYKAATAAEALGVLTGKNMAAGLHSKDPDVRERAAEIRDGIIAKFFTNSDGTNRWYKLGAKMAHQIGLGLSDAHLQFTVDVNGNLQWRNPDAKPGEDSGGVIVNGEQGSGTTGGKKTKPKPNKHNKPKGDNEDDSPYTGPSTGTSFLPDVTAAAMLDVPIDGPLTMFAPAGRPAVHQTFNINVHVPVGGDLAAAGHQLIRAIKAASQQDGGLGIKAAIRATG